jgi:hypothetical protein
MKEGDKMGSHSRERVLKMMGKRKIKEEERIDKETEAHNREWYTHLLADAGKHARRLGLHILPDGTVNAPIWHVHSLVSGVKILSWIVHTRTWMVGKKKGTLPTYHDALELAQLLRDGRTNDARDCTRAAAQLIMSKDSV